MDIGLKSLTNNITDFIVKLEASRYSVIHNVLPSELSNLRHFDDHIIDIINKEPTNMRPQITLLKMIFILQKMYGGRNFYEYLDILYLVFIGRDEELVNPSQYIKPFFGRTCALSALADSIKELLDFHNENPEDYEFVADNKILDIIIRFTN
jgi:hypothetical protein